MKTLLLAVFLLMFPPSASAMDSDLEQQYKTRRSIQYWGLGGGVVGGATAIPMTTETLRVIKSLRTSSNAVDACINAGIAIFIVPPMIVMTGATWAGGVGGTAIGLGGSLAARGTLQEAGGSVTMVPGIVGIASLSATPALLILGLESEDESLIFAGIATFAGANAMLLTQSLLNGAEYRELTGTQRGLVIPPITISGRF
ncbi:MAG: hypothetical protein ACI8RZ_006381 [Myxococcota bacterium]|jgi:hypothetical protein